MLVELSVPPSLLSLTVPIVQHVVPLSTYTDLRAKWDFIKVKVQLIASLAGKHEGWPRVVLTGHTAIMKAVRDIGARAGTRKLVIECQVRWVSYYIKLYASLRQAQGSSIGTYSTQWLNEFHHSCRGASAEEWLDAPKSRRAKLPFPPIKILFPSAATVRASRLGEAVGPSML